MTPFHDDSLSFASLFFFRSFLRNRGMKCFIYFFRDREYYIIRVAILHRLLILIYFRCLQKKKEKRKENKERKFNNIYTESMEDSPIVGESKGIVDKSWS